MIEYYRSNSLFHRLLRLLIFIVLTAEFISIEMMAATPVYAQSSASNTTKRLPVRGVVRPSAQATISTDLTARVASVGFREGASFRQGDVLVAFDCRHHKAELASAEAQHREMLVALESAQYLVDRDAGSRQDVEIARARADRAAADAEAIRVQIDRCVIRAPFDGSIAELGIHEHETPAAGAQLFFVVAEREPNIELIVPSTWLTWLKSGADFEFRVDETGKSYAGVVRRIGAAVETVSQTIKVFAVFSTPAPDILPGMSGTAQFKRQEG